MKTSDLMDHFQNELDSCEVQFNNYTVTKEFHGRCRTIKCYRDNALLKETLMKTDGHGQVLVVDGDGCVASALMGDMIAEGAQKNGWAGVIIYGAIRDSEAIGTLEHIGVKATGTNPRKSAKEKIGQLDIEIRFGNALFAPGDWVYADEDGVVVARRELPLRDIDLV